jgi:CRISPR-associated protein Csb1
VKTSSRIDPAQITRNAGTVYERAEKTNSSPDWTVDEGLATQVKNQPKKVGKDGKPSEVNHGNVTPTIENGGFTLTHAKQTTVLSLAALRRLRFPLRGASNSSNERDLIARTLLASLGLLSGVLVREQGADLRSRCLLVPTEGFIWELLENPPGTAEPKTFSLNGEQAVAIFRAALEESRNAGLPWEDEIELVPSEDLIKLVARSQELATHQAEGDE